MQGDAQSLPGGACLGLRCSRLTGGQWAPLPWVGPYRSLQRLLCASASLSHVKSRWLPMSHHPWAAAPPSCWGQSQAEDPWYLRGNTARCPWDSSPCSSGLSVTDCRARRRWPSRLPGTRQTSREESARWVAEAPQYSKKSVLREKPLLRAYPSLQESSLPGPASTRAPGERDAERPRLPTPSSPLKHLVPSQLFYEAHLGSCEMLG